MNTNYTNFSNDEIESIVNEPITAEFHDIVETVEVEDDIHSEPVEDKTKMGVVTCGKLYLRSEPSTDAKDITVLSKGEELMIVSEDDEEWYGVYTASGQEGFCKKEFIKID